jgi:uncharacterized protein
MENLRLFDETKTIVLKTNNECNLKCSYCYDDDNRNRSFSDLNMNTISEIFHEIVPFSKKRGIDYLNVIWHGGEPMLMGIDYYCQIISLQNEFDFKFNNLMQTNGVSIDKKWIQFKKKTTRPCTQSAGVQKEKE